VKSRSKGALLRDAVGTANFVKILNQIKKILAEVEGAGKQLRILDA